ncbi:MAG: S1/P1 nuclease [Alistipes sp.]|nr:S1/P1 nuclease [Alistipes sp.]
MKRRLLVLSLMLSAALQSFGWGQKGHDVIAYIAECNLAPEAYAKVVKALGGHSLVYYSNWLDNASHTPEYAYTKTWHYANVDKGLTYATMPKTKRGDVVTAVTDLSAKLKAGGLNAETEELYLKMLIHLVGDMHCPMHAGHLSDLGGNKVFVKYFGSKRKLHSVWDTALVESAHKWGYTEWQFQLDRLTDGEKVSASEGTPTDWFNQTQEICTEIYESTPAKSDLSFDYIAKYTPVIEQQFLRGGYRLARLLNDIYSDK